MTIDRTGEDDRICKCDIFDSRMDVSRGTMSLGIGLRERVRWSSYSLSVSVTVQPVRCQPVAKLFQERYINATHRADATYRQIPFLTVEAPRNRANSTSFDGFADLYPRPRGTIIEAKATAHVQTSEPTGELF